MAGLTLPIPPAAPYFRDCLSAQDLDELNIEIIRNTVRPSWVPIKPPATSH
jgi:hypothetical protein